MSKVFLMFSAALVALMAGALFYAARFPVANTGDTAESAPTAVTQAEATAQPVSMDTVSYPQFTLPDMSGAERQLSDWDGKHRILNFWATWCAPCRREIPLLKAFQDELGPNGFQILGIAVDYMEDVNRYDEEAQFNYPVLIGQEDAMAVAELSGIPFMALPFTMFVAADGELLNAHMGELHAPQLATIADVMTRLERQEISREDARIALDAL